MKPVEIPPDELGDEVAINDRILLGRERERMQLEADLAADVAARQRD